MGFKSAGILAVFALIIPSASLIISRRRATEPSRKKKEVDEALEDRLYPFLDDSASQANYPGLWDAIRGVAGVLRMSRESIAAMWGAKGLRKSDPEYTDHISREMFWTAICLWVVTIVCLAEAFPAKKERTRPRIASLWSAKLYCEMKGLWSSLKEFKERASNPQI